MTPEPGPKWRLRARAALEDYFRRRSHPRFILGTLVSIAGVVGFFVSYILLHCGIEEMWIRYPLAVIGGYLAFLVLLRLWVEIERDRYDASQVNIPTDAPMQPLPLPNRKFISDSGLSWWEWLDPSGLFVFEEGCLVGCLIAVAIGALVAAGSVLFSFIMTGSELLAEVFLDAVVVSMLYRHLKTAAREHWLGTAVRRSWRSALLLAGALGLLGGCLAAFAPNSHSLGSAVREIFGGKESR